MEESPPISVLLIEDNPTDVLLVKELLRDAPNGQFTIVTASTLAQGLKHFTTMHLRKYTFGFEP